MHPVPSTKRWTAAVGLLAALLWVVQLADAWQPLFRTGEIAHQKEAGLTQVIESE